MAKLYWPNPQHMLPTLIAGFLHWWIRYWGLRYLKNGRSWLDSRTLHQRASSTTLAWGLPIIFSDPWIFLARCQSPGWDFAFILSYATPAVFGLCWLCSFLKSLLFVFSKGNRMQLYCLLCRRRALEFVFNVHTSVTPHSSFFSCYYSLAANKTLSTTL